MDRVAKSWRFPRVTHDIAFRAGLHRFETLGQQLIVSDGIALLALPEDILLRVGFDSGEPSDNKLTEHGLSRDLAFGPHEVASANGDSTGPAFIHNAVSRVVPYGVTLDRPPLADPTGVWGNGAAWL